MKKRKFLISLLCISALLGVSTTALTSCKPETKDPATPVVEYWTVTIDLNDGSKPTTKDVVKGQMLTGVSTPTREGYQFTGWKVNGDDWTMDKAITANITIVAQWTETTIPPKEYWTVTIDLNDGSTPEAKQVEKGQKLTGVAEPTREGYEFAGWKANDADWTMDTAITVNITIVAQWTENPSPTLKSEFLEENEEDWDLSNGVITTDLVANDKMLKVTGNEEAKSNNMAFEPLTGDFKVSFNLYCDSISKSAFGIKFYDINGEQFTRLKFDTSKIKYSNSNVTLGQTFKENYWFDVDFIFKASEDSYLNDFYLNGVCLGSNLACDVSSKTLKKINFYTDSKKTGYSFYVNELSITRDLEIVTNAPSGQVIPDFPSYNEVGEAVNLPKINIYSQIQTSIDEEASIPSNAIYATPADFKAKVEALEMGQTLVLEDGIYSLDGTIKLSKSGTEESPIVIMARHTGKAVFNGRLQFQVGLFDSNTKLASGGDYYIFSGLKFKDGIATSSGIFKVYGKHFRMTNIVVDGHDKNPDVQKSVWIQIMPTGKYAEIDHCTFVNKNNSYGVLLYIDKETYDDGPMYAHIHNNYFGNYTNPDPKVYDNELETIRIGWSSAQGDSYSIVENNIFEDISSEPELISVKSCHNLIRGNLIIRCTAAITLRHGFYNIVENNIILGEGVANANGIRVFGHHQIIRNNFISGIPNNSSTFYGGLVLHNGTGDTVTGSGQCTTNNCTIENNTFVNNYFSICLGDNKYSKAPHDLTFKNNVVYTTLGAAIRQYRAVIAKSVTYQNEVYYASSLGLVDDKIPNGVKYTNQFTSIFVNLENGLLEVSSSSGAKSLYLLGVEDISISNEILPTQHKDDTFFTSSWK